MKVSVSDLSGPTLDWAVAKCEGLLNGGLCAPVKLKGDGLKNCAGAPDPYSDELPDYSPSTDWSQGGPIIEREGISICPHTLSGWAARIAPPPYCNIDDHFSHGPTPLIAAMRCYVASKFGNTIDIPSELL